MVTLEQVRQLETKIAKAIEYVNRVTGENKLLREKLESSLKRVKELEDLVQCFKEDQSRIEEGIVAALDRLNQFEDAIGRSLSAVQAMAVTPAGKPASPPAVSVQPSVPAASPVYEAPAGDSGGPDDFFDDKPGDSNGDFPPDGEPPPDSGEPGLGELDIF
ncbi:MAG: cell division protein ZapB [Treponema sp.]|jgi:hypothetical protein|nr:cell division protein ZapB [Treponema sp.]